MLNHAGGLTRRQPAELCRFTRCEYVILADFVGITTEGGKQ